METGTLESSRSGPRVAASGGSRWRAVLARRARLIRWISAGLILVAVVLLIRALPTERLLGPVQNWIESLGAWGPLALGGIYVVAALLLIPAWILTVAAGAIYGLLLGTVIVSLASTTAVAVAFLIARYLARDNVRRRIEKSPKLAAVDEAIGEQGWKIVALLRLSPAVPFNLQNYLYGVTAIRFWPCVLTSWIAMLPGTFLYVYLGSIGRTALSGGETSVAEWVIRGVGLVATLAVTVYLARLAYVAIQKRTRIEDAEVPSAESAAEQPSQPAAEVPSDSSPSSGRVWSTVSVAAGATALLALAVWATARQDDVRRAVEQLLGLRPTVTAVEAYEPKPAGPTFDHSTFDALLVKHVDSGGWVDYQRLQRDAGELQHSHPRWFRFRQREVVQLTELYDWYRGDFTQEAESVLDYAARFSSELREALDAGRRPEIEWLSYDWRLNSQQNRQAGGES